MHTHIQWQRNLMPVTDSENSAANTPVPHLTKVTMETKWDKNHVTEINAETEKYLQKV